MGLREQRRVPSLQKQSSRTKPPSAGWIFRTFETAAGRQASRLQLPGLALAQNTNSGSFQNQLLTKAMQECGPESGGRDFAVIPLMNERCQPPQYPQRCSQEMSDMPRATYATATAPSVPHNSPRRAPSCHQGCFATVSLGTMP